MELNQEYLKKIESVKNTLLFDERKKQIEVFAPIAREIIIYALNKGELTNKILTAFVQMFKANCTKQTFEKYAKEIFLKTEDDENIFKKYNFFYNSEEKIFGYTNAARAKIDSLTDKELEEFSTILKNIIETDNYDELKKLADKIFEHNFKYLKFGIVSPWLYYLKPKYYPIINSKTLSQFKKLGANNRKFSDLMDIAKRLKEELKIEDLGYIDTILYELINNFEPTTGKSNINKINNKQISKNIILYGTPGTGKTYNTKKRALEIIVGKGEVNNDNIDDLYKEYGSYIEFVTFHQSFAYEQFVEGISAKTVKGSIEYTIKDGIFKSLCITAILSEDDNSTDDNTIDDNSTDDNNADDIAIIDEFIKTQENKQERKGYFKNNRPFVLIIDEINRGNISKIFGELITLIEDDKRLGEDNEIIVTLPYSNKKFGIPPNLYIIGTMNTADRSLVQLDTALRRRFSFEEMMPNYDVEEIWENPSKVTEFDLKEFLRNLNLKITEKLDREHQIGHSYMMKIKDIESLQYAWENNILPLLQEYFYADYGTLGEVIGTDSCYLKNGDLTLKCKENFKDEFQKIYNNVTNNKNK